ncbi:major tail protein [Bacillus sp. FSL M8-0256]|uniref:major tail protein n=1 Tax=Bacillus sp. FSL M8-0256 TaxID=2954578 RepID=UPI0030FA8AFA
MATTGLRDIRVGVFEDDAAKEATEVINVPGAIESKLEPSSEIAVIYGDDGVFDQEGSGVGEAKLEINVADLTTEMKNKLLGADAIGGWLEAYGKDTDPPFVAITFRQKTKGGFWYVGLLRGKFGIPSTEGKTKEDKVEFITPTIEGQFMPRKFDGLTYVMAYSGSPGFTEKAFYDFVFKGITPSTDGDNGTAEAPSSTTTKK